MAELEPPWKCAFTVETPAVAVINHDAIWLAQFSRSEFYLHSTIHYDGETGLEKLDLKPAYAASARQTLAAVQ